MDDIFEQLIKNLERMESENGETVVFDGKRIGPGKGASRNLDVGTKVHETKEDALAYEAFQKSKSEGVDPDSEDNDKIIEKYIEEIVERDILEGL